MEKNILAAFVLLASLVLCLCGSNDQVSEYKAEKIEKSLDYSYSLSVKDAVLSGENDSSIQGTNESASNSETRTETIYYNTDGSVSSHIMIKTNFDKNGNATYSEYENVLASPGLVLRSWTTYDDQGNTQTIKLLNTSGIGDTQEYKYDDYGNVLELYLNGELSEYHLYKYDEQNRVIEDVCNLTTDYYNGGKDWAYTIFYTYNDSDKVAKEVMYNARNDVETTYTYDYSNFDTNGTYTETITYSDETPELITTYNKNGSIVRYESDDVTQIFEYNDHGDMQRALVTMKYTDENGNETLENKVTQYINEYDASGRLESTKTYSNGKLESELYTLRLRGEH